MQFSVYILIVLVDCGQGLREEDYTFIIVTKENLRKKRVHIVFRETLSLA